MDRLRAALVGAAAGEPTRDVPAITNVRHVDLLPQRARGARSRRGRRRGRNAGRVRARGSHRGAPPARRGHRRAHVGRRAARDLRAVLHRQVELESNGHLTDEARPSTRSDSARQLNKSTLYTNDSAARLRRDRHRRRPCRRRGGVGGGADGPQRRDLHAVGSDGRAHAVQPGGRRHGEGSSGSRDRRARRLDGHGDRRDRHPVQAAQSQPRSRSLVAARAGGQAPLQRVGPPRAARGAGHRLDHRPRRTDSDRQRGRHRAGARERRRRIAAARSS